MVRPAAEAALLGTDDDVRAFLARLDDLQTIDERVVTLQVYSGGGPAVRAAALKALDDDTIGTFLQTGWQEALHTDQRVRVQQLMAAGGPQLKAAGTAALDADTAGAPSAAMNMTEEADGPLDDFLSRGWRDPDEVDKRVTVGRIYAKAPTGSNVRRMAQRALDDGSLEALQEFIDSGYTVASAWDEEASAITGLVATAETASAEARNQLERAKETAEQAKTAGAEAKKSAEAALAAMESAGSNAAKAHDAANRAANATEQASKAAQQALAASDAARTAARQAAAAAARAMTLASLARRAANRANKSAADAAVDKKNAATASANAAAANTAAKAAEDASQFLQNMVIISTTEAITSANQAETDATSAISSALQALSKAKKAGVNVAAAEAAAARARAQADKARRAAIATRKYATVAVDAANTAVDAAKRAASDARAAATRALEAVAHAGDATRAAQASTDAANAAVKSAEDSVAAATKAYDTYAAGRAADAERVAVIDAQGATAARAGLAVYEHYEQGAAWNAQEAAKRDAQTNELIAKVRSPLTDRAVAVAAARQVAMTLSVTGGPQTRESAVAALADTDDQVMGFVKTGIDAAAAADDRTKVSALAYDENINLARAALAALAGTDADVALFLRNQDYPERSTDDRVAVGRVLAAAQKAGNPVTVQQATAALDGDDAGLRAFLKTGQYDAASTDARVQANRILGQAAQGTYLYAAARNALDGPPGQLQEFLVTGRYLAARDDYDAAVQDQEMQALLARGIGAAFTATQNAQEAQSVAAKARGNADEAIAWANKAITAANTAGGYATKAADWASKAEASAKSAIASANTAAEAAQRADEAANDASRSVAKAQAAYDNARASANEAIGAARRARDSAISAGKDANTAIGIYNDMVKRINVRMRQEESDRNAALMSQLTACLHDAGPIESRIKQCYLVYQPTGVKIAKATENRKFCNLMAPEGSEYYRACVSDAFNPLFSSNRAMDMVQSEMTYLRGVSVVMSVATALVAFALGCAAVCTAALTVLGGAEASMGIGGLFGIWIEEQTIAWAAGAGLSMINGSRLLNEFKSTFGRIRVPAALERVSLPAKILDSNLARMIVSGLRCPGNSFTGNTPVVMGNRSAPVIGTIRAGYPARSTDVLTGASEPRRFTDFIEDTGDKQPVKISVDGDGGTGIGAVTAADNHPFWVAGPGEWRDAGALAVGDWLRTSSGTWVQVTAIRPGTGTTTVHKLTVDDFHTYDVQAGSASVLVANAVTCRPLALGYKISGVYQWARRKGYEHFEDNPAWRYEVNDRLRQEDSPPIYVLMSGFDRGLSTQAGDFDGFLTSAFKGVKRLRPKYVSSTDFDKYADATQVEMFTMVKAFYDYSNGNGGRQTWKNIKFFNKDEELIDEFAPVDWWNAVKLYGKGDAKMLEQLNADWKKALDETRYNLEKAAGTL